MCPSFPVTPVLVMTSQELANQEYCSLVVLKTKTLYGITSVSAEIGNYCQATSVNALHATHLQRDTSIRTNKAAMCVPPPRLCGHVAHKKMGTLLIQKRLPRRMTIEPYA